MSKRIPRVNELIKEEISRIIFEEIEFPTGVLVTVAKVDTSKDLRNSNIFITALPEENLSGIVDSLNKRSVFLQKKMNKLLRMRPLPRIRFAEEREASEAGRIEEILEQLKKGKK